MKQTQRDSPEEPCTRASRSPEGEVYLFRDFPRGNQKGGLLGLPRHELSHLLTLFMGLGLWLHLPALSLSTSECFFGFGFRGTFCLHLASTSHTWSHTFSHGNFLCSLADCQPPTGSSNLSSNVKVVFDLSKEGESHLPLGSVPPPQPITSP